ncbi:MAG: Gfo/Idh/MocA family protein [Armatimonadota bacterium]
MKVAMIGCGGIAQAHLHCIHEAGDELVAAVDSNPQQAGKAAGAHGGQAMATVAEMLQVARPDAVIVATPPNVHRAVVSEVLDAGIPVLCEKPLAHTVDDCEALVAMAERAGVPAYVAYCHRFNPAARFMREKVRDGSLGAPLYFLNQFIGYAPDFRNLWRTIPEIAGGGVAADNASHSVDLFQYIIGPVADVSAALYFEPDVRGEMAASLLVTSESGVPGHITVGWVNSKDAATFEVCGTEQTLSYDYAREQDSVLSRRLGQEPELLPLGGAASVRFLQQYLAFRGAIMGRPSPAATFAEGLAVARVIDRCYRQAAAVR